MTYQFREIQNANSTCAPREINAMSLGHAKLAAEKRRTFAGTVLALDEPNGARHLKINGVWREIGAES
jgi:hypothetical protein